VCIYCSVGVGPRWIGEREETIPALPMVESLLNVTHRLRSSLVSSEQGMLVDPPGAGMIDVPLSFGFWVIVRALTGWSASLAGVRRLVIAVSVPVSNILSFAQRSRTLLAEGCSAGNPV